MACYVDDVEHPFRGMKMCHLWADNAYELFTMVDKIGVDRRHLQQPPKASWLHFDISLSKKKLALANGAILTDQFGPVEHCARLTGNVRKLKMVEYCRGLRATLD